MTILQAAMLIVGQLVFWPVALYTTRPIGQGDNES